MNSKFLFSSAVLSLLAVSATVSAADFVPGAYVLGGAGVTRYDLDFSGQVRNAYAGSGFGVNSATREDHNDAGFQIGGGYQFLPWLGVELAYVDLGKQETDYSVTPTNGGTTTRRHGDYKLHGLNASAVGTYPLTEKFSIFGKVGVFHSRLKYTESSSTPYPGSTNTSFAADDDRQTKASFGLGAAFKANEKISIRAGWDRVQNIGENFALTATGNGQFSHVDFYSVNVLYHF
ncbi:MAG: outer membrane beta-barrel protein [Pseudomonadota bacterium]